MKASRNFLYSIGSAALPFVATGLIGGLWWARSGTLSPVVDRQVVEVSAVAVKTVSKTYRPALIYLPAAGLFQLSGWTERERQTHISTPNGATLVVGVDLELRPGARVEIGTYRDGSRRACTISGSICGDVL